MIGRSETMAVHFNTKTPNKLLKAFKKAIDDGHVKTWSYDDEGDFTHTAEQWIKRAWLSPKVTDGERLSFFIVPPREAKISSEVYAIYHGRFIETMLRHCDSLFGEGRASALPEGGDKVG
jgi:hypothetical protein